MRIVLDSNEYILGLDTTKGPSPSSRLLDLVRILIDESEEFRLLVPDIIVREVQRNLPPELEKDFFRLIEESPKKIDQGIWHGVAGMRGVKTVLERDIILPLRDREMAKRFKVRLPRGVLFYGPPGCGKTHMARKLADANINVTANGKRSRKRGQKTLELHANMSYVNIQ